MGRTFAASLGYDEKWVESLPEDSVAAFTGVSNVSVSAVIPPRSTILDLGCGAGLDSLIAARRGDAGSKVIGIDFSAAMLARARRAALAEDAANVFFSQAAAERLPIPDGRIDVALVNGIFNLNPARNEIFGELARVMRSGGTVYAAELILREPLQSPPDANSWFA